VSTVRFSFFSCHLEVCLRGRGYSYFGENTKIPKITINFDLELNEALGALIIIRSSQRKKQKKIHSYQHKPNLQAHTSQNNRVYSKYCYHTSQNKI
jgi:hypothetical protein